ncbi:tyrosine-type recombinase/integrase [Dysgonomonas sp. Marseille-P4677]|nr:tyrosine-type recombinase/integrase [Dysgonomonas sp. Marseille-P4677]
MITSLNTSLCNRLIKSRQSLFNCYLKEIAGICGIQKNLSFHMSRHTFATLALNKGVSLESVSKILGHTNIRTTMIYANITDQKIESEMNRMRKKK